MRQPYCTITPASVRFLARQTLAHALPWQDFGRQASAAKILDLLLLIAALSRSLSAIAKRFGFGFSHETARQAVHANLPDLATLTRHLLDGLYLLGSRALRRRPWVVAIDEHRVPFYGERSTFGVTGGQKKHGTKYAFGYATAVVVHGGRRSTVGLLALTGGEKPHQVVATLLKQVRHRGLKVRGVVLDSGFDSGDTLLVLQEQKLSYSVPLRRKGNRKNQRNALWDLAVGTITTVRWKTDQGNRPVTTQAVVMRRRGETPKKVLAFGGWSEKAARSESGRARLARRWYRKRFGIETSYRQMRQGRAGTTATDVAYRLLLVGLGFVLRQAWVWLSEEIRRQRRQSLTAQVGEWPLQRLLDWLADALRSIYKEDQEIRLESPLPPFNGYA
jgi:hypothetical protein